MPNTSTAHQDTFVRDNLPPWEQRPTFLNVSAYPGRLNAAATLLDRVVEEGEGERIVFRTPSDDWTYCRLLDAANRIAAVLLDDLNVVPGNRVLLRAPNHPLLIASWFAVLKAGAVAVPTMPLLRAGELTKILRKADVAVALCDERLQDELWKASEDLAAPIRVCTFDAQAWDNGDSELARLARRKSGTLRNTDTFATDAATILFTSGTTGAPKAAVHDHRDLVAVTDHYPAYALQPTRQDVFIGTSPFAFAYGLGALVLFPMRYRACSVLLEEPRPQAMLEAIDRFQATLCMSTPTAYHMMMADASSHQLASLRTCVSAGEALPVSTFQRWRDQTGIAILDGIGTTELLHIFMSACPDRFRPGSTGTAVPGYQARLISEKGEPVAAGELGRLAVRGPTGCRYLADERQSDYVVNGWNLTGDLFTMDDQGFFWFQGRADDLIVTSGYKIAAREVEDALLSHPAVAECAVVGATDAVRGNIVKAFVVPRIAQTDSTALISDLQSHVKTTIAPYKYPRVIEFLTELPKTPTGKVKRFALR